MKPILAALASALILSGCMTQKTTPSDSRSAVSTASTPVAAPLLPPELFLTDYPLPPDARRTTSGESYLAHLQGRLQKPAVDSKQALALAGVRYQRYQILGNLEDLDAAFAEAKAQGTRLDASDDAKLLWATLAAYMHEFDAAESALNRLGADKATQKLQLQKEINTARGKLVDLRAPSTELAVGQEFTDLVSRAGRCVDRGDLFCATQNFHQAQFFYNDVAPLPLAWLHTQQGIALLRFGHPEAAIPFFEAALARLPNYYLAAEHRAECLGLVKRFDEARAQYQSVITQTGNPEYMAGLADVETQAGDVAQAQVWQDRAVAGYQARLDKFPNAYAQHAVDFYLQAGMLATAHRLAEQNLLLRQDVGSYVLRAEVALAEQNSKDFCAAYTKAKASGLNPPELNALGSEAKAMACESSRS